MTRSTVPSPTSAPAREPWRKQAHTVALVALLTSVAILAAAGAVAWSWRGDLPELVATQFDGGGYARVLSPVRTAILAPTGLGLALVVMFATLCWCWGRAAIIRRFGAGVSIGVAVTVGGSTVWMLAGQRGLADAADAHQSPWAVVVIFVAAVVLAVGAAALVPADLPQPATLQVPSDAARVPLAATERAVWLGQARNGVGMNLLLVLGLAVSSLAPLLTGTWPMLAIPLLLAVFFLACAVYHVRVDATGLTVRAAAGWPRTHLPAAEVLGASVTHVEPLKWGGWGWRLRTGGGSAVVTRRGEALHIERTGGRTLTITCDDAAAGAALLNTMADRTRG